jgi:hypothetical protein
VLFQRKADKNYHLNTAALFFVFFCISVFSMANESNAANNFPK